MERIDSISSFATAGGSTSNTSFCTAQRSGSDSSFVTTGEATTSSTGGRELRDQPSDVQEVAAILARFRRSGNVLQQALNANGRLRACLDSLRASRLPVHLQEKVNRLMQSTWIYLDLDYVGPVMDELENGVTLGGKLLRPEDLRSWHVIAGPVYYPIVEAIIDGLRTADIDRNWICRTADVRIPMPHHGDSAHRVVPSEGTHADSSEHESSQASDLVQLPSQQQPELQLCVQIDTDEETDSLVPKSVGARPFLGAPGRLGVTGSHMTSHLQRDKTFLHVRLSGTSAGKRTWPLSKKDEERMSKKMRGDESRSLAAATAASQASQSLGGYTEYFESQEMEPILEAVPENPESGDVPEATSALLDHTSNGYE